MNKYTKRLLVLVPLAVLVLLFVVACYWFGWLGMLYVGTWANVLPLILWSYGPLLSVFVFIFTLMD